MSASDDESFLDEILDRAVEALASGTSLDPAGPIAERPHLRERILETFRVAEEVAVVRPAALPAVAGYELVRELGRGASGAVYLARQESLGGRAVALKVLATSLLPSPRARQRFFEEARALARLRHPHVVAVHDVVDRDGTLAIAMEWVEGRPLSSLIAHLASLRRRPRIEDAAEYLRAELGERSTHELFARLGLEVARALDEVHVARLLHRDVKPSNVLLRSDGSALLSDFGLVRVEGDSMATETGVFMGTPAFAAPEQLGGRWSEVDERTDVYGLGAALYHALTLQLPYPGRNERDILRRVDEGFLRTPRSLDARIPRDLETIVLVAMDVEPGRRYASASALADDLERFLAGRPILARPPSAIYQFGRLVGRHRVPFALLGVLFLALVAFGAVMLAVNDRLRELALEIASQSQEIETKKNEALAEAERARVEAQRSERVTETWLETLGAVNPFTGGSDLLVRDLFAAAATQAEWELAEEPEVLAAVRLTLGRGYSILGRLEEAGPLLDAALAHYREAHRDDDPDLGHALGAVAAFAQASGDLERAGELFRESLGLLRETSGEDSEPYANALSSLGVWHAANGEVAPAEAAFRRAISIFQALELERDTVEVRVNLAATLQMRGDLEGAEAMIREVLAIYEEVAPPDHLPAAQTMQNLSGLLAATGRLEEAEEVLRRSLEIQEAKLGFDNPRLAPTLTNLARTLSALSDLDESEELTRRALEALRADYGDEHADVGRVLLQRVDIHLSRGLLDEAETDAARSLEILRAALPESHPDVGRSALYLGVVRRLRGNSESARDLLAEALAVQESALGADHPDLGDTLFHLGRVTHELERHGEALPIIERCHEVRRSVWPDTSEPVVATLFLLSSCLRSLARYDEAEAQLEARIAALSEEGGPQAEFLAGKLGEELGRVRAERAP